MSSPAILAALVAVSLVLGACGTSDGVPDLGVPVSSRAAFNEARTAVGDLLERQAETEQLTTTALDAYAAVEAAYLASARASTFSATSGGWSDAGDAWRRAEEALSQLPARHASLAAAMLRARETIGELDGGGSDQAAYRAAETEFLDALDAYLAADRAVAETLLAAIEAYREVVTASETFVTELETEQFRSEAGAAAAYRSTTSGFPEELNAFNAALADAESRRAALAPAVQEAADLSRRAFEALDG